MASASESQILEPTRAAELLGRLETNVHEVIVGKDDVASYLQAYAAKFKLPVRLNTKVASLTRADSGYVAKAGGGGPPAEE